MEVVRTSQGGLTPDINVTYDDSIKNTDNINNDNGNDDVKVENINDQRDTKEDQIKTAVNKLNKFLEDSNTYAVYEIHDKFKDIMIKIVDSRTKEVIKEIPSKKILDMIAKLCELTGVLVDKKA